MEEELTSLLTYFQHFEKGVLYMQDCKKLGDLDDVGSLPGFLEMADKYIAAQDKDITECAAAFDAAFQGKL